MQCEMCGKESNLIKALIEGTELKVCPKCGKHGKIIGIVKPDSPKEKKKLEKIEKKQVENVIEKEILSFIVPDFAARIHAKREASGLSQKDFAKKINEKESVFQKIESGKTVPSIALARKLERLLSIKLIDEKEEEKANFEKMKSNEFTIGDFIKVRKS